MRKGDDGGEKRENTSLAEPGALAHRLQRRTAFKIKIGRRTMMKIVATNVVANRLPNGDRLQHRSLVPKYKIYQPSAEALVHVAVKVPQMFN